ncbi:MAG: hypothetical protein R6U96_00570 [Promethearchaeia archaeon]
MPKEPPFCVICEKDFTEKLDQLHYCIFDKAVCRDCLNSVRKNDKMWICPVCQAENDIKSTELFKNAER